MIEALRFIQICNHKIYEEVEEEGETSVNRNERRKDDVFRERDPRIVYSGTWTPAGTVDDAYMKTSNTGSTLDIYFYGDNINVYGLKSSTGAKVEIYIDSKLEATVDLHAASSSVALLHSATSLGYKPHKITVKLINSSQGSEFTFVKCTITEGVRKEISPYDEIKEGEVVSKILKVWQDIGTKRVVYREGKEYKLIGANRIKWISYHRPTPSHPYTVKYVKKRPVITEYKESSCPRCYGLLWYGSLTDVVTGEISANTGLYKICEDIIRMILTQDGPSDYSSQFFEFNKNLYVSGDQVVDIAKAEIDRLEKFYIEQQNRELAQGAEYTSADLLYAIEVNDATFNTSDYSLAITITVYNREGKGAQTTVNNKF